MVPVAARTARTRPTPSTARTCRTTSGSGSSSRTTTGTTATPRSCSSASTAHSGEDRYVYHGNDGTSFPWNDTAQLDFLDPDVREQVIRTILDVARRFPIIRFDAAMVLAKKHIQRLWWPEPGGGAGIPSRAEHAMPKKEFDARMPAEFWREVVDRVAAEVPGTLLLAEAFWLLEGYFVRTLGMHRVYNSAFMHMLRDEDGAGYRKVIRETIEFDPEILKRYVNFMSNPDEKTALEQFGKGDKYFGVATMLATLPGLPMLGHGQVQGFGEKYGMEFQRATLDERPDPDLVARHEREIFPLLHRRAWFAEAHALPALRLRDRWRRVDEHVFAYSNGAGPERSLVVFHDRFALDPRVDPRLGGVRGQGAGRLEAARPPLARRGPRPAERPGAFVIFRDARTGLESLRSCREIWERGLRLSLDAYAAHVFWEFREVRDGSAGQWARLAARLAGAAVPSLDDALRELQLEPVHGPFRAIFADGLVGSRPRGCGDADPARRARASVRRLPGRDRGGDRGCRRSGGRSATATRARIERVFGRRRRHPSIEWNGRPSWPGSRWVGLGELAPGADVAATSRAWYDELRLAGALASGLREAGLDEGEAWAVADLVRVLLALPRPSGLRGPARTSDARLLDQWLARDVVRTAIGLNTWQGVEYVDRDAFEAMLRWAARLDAIETRDADHHGRRCGAGPAAGAGAGIRQPPGGGRGGRRVPGRQPAGGRSHPREASGPPKRRGRKA